MATHSSLTTLTTASPAIFLQSAPLVLQMLPPRDIVAPPSEQAARENFVWTMAHELRQPLSVLSTAVAMIRQDSPTEATARAVDVMGRQVRQMSRIIEDLVDAARLSNGKVSVQLERLDLREVITEAAADVTTALAERHHTFELQCGPLPMWIRGDSQRLHQVFSNLLRNAISYTDPGGRITVSVESGPLTITARVRDTGVGIAAPGLARIFDLFAQIQPNATGLGIGLNVVREIVSLHSGVIEAHSDGLGRGSEFVVVLPRID